MTGPVHAEGWRPRPAPAAQAEEVRCRWCGSAADVEVVPAIGEPTSAER